jgi:hypothetical protein
LLVSLQLTITLCGKAVKQRGMRWWVLGGEYPGKARSRPQEPEAYHYGA